MENKFIFGGFIRCHGVLKDGTPWQGFRVMLARVRADGTIPAADVYKSSCTDSMTETLLGLPLSATVEVYFDERGRVAMLVQS